MVLPAQARKQADIQQGDVVEVLPEGKGRIVLVRLERPGNPRAVRAKINYRKGRHAVGSTGRPVTSSQIRKLLEEL